MSHHNLKYLSEAIKKAAAECGIHQTGFAPVHSVTNPERFTQWLKQNHHGDMRWLERDIRKRLNPSDLFSDARSVIVCALNYYQPGSFTAGTSKARISRYAWGKDYHVVMFEKLSTLLNQIQNLFSGISGRCFVDCSPVMEKYWAQAAGIGWLGKNSLIISPRFGSWIFLGVILINQELIYDKPAESQCGACRLCQESCPNHALQEPFILDARKCISYRTIEFKGIEFSDNTSLIHHNWIYGCDICQDICPWNVNHQKKSTITEFLPLNREIRHDEFVLMDESGFYHKFQGTVIERLGFERFKRNGRIIFKSELFTESDKVS